MNTPKQNKEQPTLTVTDLKRHPGFGVTTTVKAGDVDFAAEGRKLL